MADKSQLLASMRNRKHLTTVSLENLLNKHKDAFCCVKVGYGSFFQKIRSKVLFFNTLNVHPSLIFCREFMLNLKQPVS